MLTHCVLQSPHGDSDFAFFSFCVVAVDIHILSCKLWLQHCWLLDIPQWWMRNDVRGFSAGMEGCCIGALIVFTTIGWCFDVALVLGAVAAGSSSP